MPSKSFDFTGGWQKWEVPNNVEYVTVTMDGGGTSARRSGRVTGRIKVTDKQTLWIQVGGKGKPNKGNEGGASVFGGGGAGGDGRGNPGGEGGGGASAIRLNSSTGLVKAVAGGAGGSSGDGGLGGRGGGLVGGAGAPGNAGKGSVGNATGGTQTQGGNKGTSGAGASYNGDNATDTVLARGGRGGGPGTPKTYGGGGGGGGYRAGGGGQAALIDETAGGGGGGGSNYVGGLIGYTNLQAEGTFGDGSVTLSWVTPAPANQPPHPPTEVKIDGNNITDAYATQSTGSVLISAKLGDPDKRYNNDGEPLGPSDKVRLVVRYSPTEDFSRQVEVEQSDLVEQENFLAGEKKETGRAGVRLRGLTQNTRYYARLYARDSNGLLSTNYSSINFWTNRFPTAPTLTAPAENATISELASAVFQWSHQDPDLNSSQRAFSLQWRRSRTPIAPAGDWRTVEMSTWFNQWVANPGQFSANSFYEWRVRTMDSQGKWGPYSDPRSFFISGQSAPPTPLEPIKGEARDVTKPVTFKWQFRDPDQGDEQTKADLRYRARDLATEVEPQWVTVLGTTVTPGGAGSWTFSVDTFIPGRQYEWQVRTTDSVTSAVSQWSESEFFWAVSTPGVGGFQWKLTEGVDRTDIQGALGCGNNRVFVYDRGGMNLRGEITPVNLVRWHRRRDDIANAIIDTNGFGADCGELLGSLRSWIHEVVIFRDGVRVFEGPITRITYAPGSVEIEAKDCMAYVYRRIMRQGYNDSYRVVNGEQLGQATVVERATRIAMNALAPDDPNLLPYLTSLDFPDDARQSRVAPDFSKTAWEEIDDLAATAGLDYTTVGRRIMFWDTHRPIGRLPEMRDENFSEPPVVTEYGMSMATFFGVTNNSGVWGGASRDNTPYGIVEQLASAYGETEGGAEETLTSEARAALETTLARQAERNISGRYPTPLVVRVPDNSTIHPETPVGIQQLIPGVWIPLRARGTVREVAQWQKLDLLTVEQTESGEKIMVTMSPAPNGGQDPDAEAALLLEE